MPSNKKYDVIVVGAGASGLIAAGKAAERGGKVLLLEKMKKAGSKLLLTGNRRCNITNTSGESVYYNNIFPSARFLKHAFSRFFSDDIIKLLNSKGVEVNIEAGNRAFPRTNKSSDVLNALMDWIHSQRVEVVYGTRVEEILLEDDRAIGVKCSGMDEKQTYYATNVMICTGGKSYPATGSTGDGYSLAEKTGHSIIGTRPALVPLVVMGTLANKLQGLALDEVKAVLWVNGKKYKEANGEILFTHYGLSGPVILFLSRWVIEEINNNNKVEISIDLIPDIPDEQQLDLMLMNELDKHGNKQFENILKQWLPGRLAMVLPESLGIDGAKPGNQVKSAERRKITMSMKDFRFNITGDRGFKEAIITVGGINTDEINSKTMESKLIKNLYFAGEVINLDGNTGGFNLQLAFSTGWLAAENCMKE